MIGKTFFFGGDWRTDAGVYTVVDERHNPTQYDCVGPHGLRFNGWNPSLVERLVNKEEAS